MDKKNWIIILVIVIAVILIAGYFLFKKAPIINQNTMENNTEGLKIETFAEGSGEGAKSGDTVTVNYTGMLTDGTAFDSNVDPKFKHVQPFALTLGENRVIQGWELGLLGMKVGEKRKLTVSPELGYGSTGAGGGLIPPNATLIFEVELLKIN